MEIFVKLVEIELQDFQNGFETFNIGEDISEAVIGGNLLRHF